MRTSALSTVCLALALASTSACGTSSSGSSADPPRTGDRAPSKQAPSGGNDAPVPSPPAGAAGARFEDPTFLLQATPGGPHAVNSPATFEISLVPRGAYHVNTEYPMKITLTPPAGVSAPRPVLQVADAAELTQTRARFSVPFTASAAGEHRMLARVEFAVCTDENCIPDERTLAVVLPVRAN
ncbi:MAG: hypothetical protein IT379_05160 [Deltaproteobacteria bacterium]|nr:hypothetical protein [Deltaproteobacteria bacterium]